MDEKQQVAVKPVVGMSDVLTFEIPVELVREFKQNVRIVIKYPGIIGVPVPDVFLNQDVLKINSIREFEPMLVPRQLLR